ncbi:collagen-binding protein [Bifidobacterium margollesii]|uniref:Collagen-binding protein n=1 Tax=Bifidobacterium margollesii TaxID=2020964 RepID=A0A2N5JAW3_9BIFI|nr:prealbumin-like fold domain-containing protein [Bifidobacterium margollesii]PLS31349.1 collagen-binding protein [Bifidobacterium margollesii]
MNTNNQRSGVPANARTATKTPELDVRDTPRTASVRMVRSTGHLRPVCIPPRDGRSTDGRQTDGRRMDVRHADARSARRRGNGIRRAAVGVIAASGMVAGLAAGATTANAAPPYDITIKAATASRGGRHSLTGRQFTAYKLAEYVNGTYVSVGNKQLDGVAVETPSATKGHLNRVLARTTGVADVAKLPGWAQAGSDPIAWMGGFRQHQAGNGQPGNRQDAGYFGFGWNESGPQRVGNNSPAKAYTGSVREFADNLVKDSAALTAVKAQPHSATVTCKAADSCTIPLTANQGTGVYLILDTAGTTTWSGRNVNGHSASWTVGSTQPMIVPTRPDDKDVATMDGYKPSDRTKLGTTGTLGEIVVKNVVDEEVLPPSIPKQRDETVNPGKDAADNGSDVGDVIPYVVSYRIADMSAYRAALDNGDKWSYEYRVLDYTQPGLKITDTPTVDLYVPEANLYDAKGKALARDKVTGADGKTLIKPRVSIPLTRVTGIPQYAAKGAGTATGQAGQPDAWYYLQSGANDETHMIVGLGKWIVKNYGDIRLNDRTKTLYGSQLAIRYSATITPKILAHQNMTHNENWLDYTDTPHDVNSGSHHSTPHVIIRQWTYDIDLHKRSSTSNTGLAGAEFKVTVKDNANPADGKTNGGALKLVRASSTAGDYRLAVKGESGTDLVVTGRDGLLRLRGLDMGTYTLTETKAPKNYQLLKSSEDVRISAKFVDDPANFITPDHQTESKLTISRNNRIVPLLKPMFNFAVTQANAPKGLTITATDAYWSGTDGSGKYYADDKTDWVSTDLTLWNQPINVMLAKTGGWVGLGLIAVTGIAAIIGGVLMLVRRNALRG